jgi:hypothetical protein
MIMAHFFSRVPCVLLRPNQNGGGWGEVPSENLPLTAARLLSMLGRNEQAAVD